MMAIEGNKVVGFTSFKVEDLNMRKNAYTRPGKGDHRLFIGTPRGRGTTSISLPIRPRGLVLAGDKVFLAGPEDADPAKRAMLVCHSAKDGKELSRIELKATPIFDGMAAAEEKLYLSTKDGKLLCLVKK